MAESDLDFSFLEGIDWWHLLTILVLIVGAAFIAKLLTIYLKKSLTDKIKRSQLDLLIKVVNYSVLVLAALMLLPIFEVELGGLLVAGGFLSIVIGIASQSVLGNLISGVFLIVERPISIGDNISIGDVAGDVADLNIFSTIVKTYDGVYVRIPNETVFTSAITNYVAHAARRFSYVVGIPYDADAGRAIEIIRAVIDEHPFALKNPEPSVYVDELADNSVNIKVKIWAPASEWWGVYTDLLWKIKAELERNGIEIPFPQRVVWFQNELALRKGLRVGEAATPVPAPEPTFPETGADSAAPPDPDAEGDEGR
ncbi:mechanosensitive ion channel family protein [Methanofollis formosanus]|uniref:Mechanosensitive ion channel family protein n=1 Tax=Methanofollis formosanus TaxID=299308 RepID=A0A8G1EH01_9EURY|nr:mechanosensitive ion channel family protein [Methanofollis formosanus]QYZ79457.1 mechanosensitive ion channel family protein [Methanofollis formosanus]